MLRNFITKIPGFSTLPEFSVSSPCNLQTLRSLSPIERRRHNFRKCDQPKNPYRRSYSFPCTRLKSYELLDTRSCNIEDVSNLKLQNNHPTQHCSCKNITYDNKKPSLRDSETLVKSEKSGKRSDEKSYYEKTVHNEYDNYEVTEQYELEASRPKKSHSETGYNVFAYMDRLERDQDPMQHLQPSNLQPFGSAQQHQFPVILRNKNSNIIELPKFIDEELESNRSSVNNKLDDVQRRDYSTNSQLMRKQMSSAEKLIQQLPPLSNEDFKEPIRRPIRIPILKSEESNRIKQISESMDAPKICKHKLAKSKYESEQIAEENNKKYTFEALKDPWKSDLDIHPKRDAFKSETINLAESKLQSHSINSIKTLSSPPWPAYSESLKFLNSDMSFNNTFESKSLNTIHSNTELADTKLQDKQIVKRKCHTMGPLTHNIFKSGLRSEQILKTKRSTESHLSIAKKSLSSSAPDKCKKRKKCNVKIPHRGLEPHSCGPDPLKPKCVPKFEAKLTLPPPTKEKPCKRPDCCEFAIPNVQRPLEPASCAPEPPKPKCFLPSKIRLKPPPCTPPHKPCPDPPPCLRADDCLLIEPKELPILQPPECPCIDFPMPDINPRLKRLKFKFVDPPRECPCNPCPCERADDCCVVKRKKLKPYIPKDCPCVEPPELIEVPLKRLQKTCEPEALCYPPAICPPPEPCIRADDCLIVPEKQLPPLCPPPCPCVDKPPMVDVPPLRRLNLHVPEPDRNCPRPCICNVDCIRADDELPKKQKKLKKIIPKDCPCTDVEMTDWNFKRLECKDEEICYETDPCKIQHPRADMGCWEYYTPEEDKCKEKKKKKCWCVDTRRKFNTDSRTQSAEFTNKSINISKLNTQSALDNSNDTLSKETISKSKPLKNNVHVTQKHVSKRFKAHSTIDLLNNLSTLEKMKKGVIPIKLKANKDMKLKHLSDNTIRSQSDQGSTILLNSVRNLSTTNEKRTNCPKSQNPSCKKLDLNCKKKVKKCEKMNPCPEHHIECACAQPLKKDCNKERLPVCCEDKVVPPYASFSELIDEKIAPYTDTAEWSCNNRDYGFQPRPENRKICDPSNKCDKKSYSTSVKSHAPKVALKKSEFGSKMLTCPKFSRPLSCPQNILGYVKNNIGFLASANPHQFCCRFKHDKKGDYIYEKKPCPKFKIDECVCPKPDIRECHQKLEKVEVCQKLEAPFRAFTDCLNEELAESLAECPLEREKYEMMQPKKMKPVDPANVLTPVQPRVGRIDPKVEEECIRRELCIENKGLTQTCDTFGCFVKPMKSKVYMEKPPNKDCERIKELKKQGRWPPYYTKNMYSTYSANNMLNFNAQRRNICLCLHPNTVPTIKEQDQNSKNEQNDKGRNYHALCKKSEKNLIEDTDSKEQDTPQYIATDGESMKRHMKPRNVQWRIDNFQKWHRLNKLNSIDRTLRRFYSCSEALNKLYLKSCYQKYINVHSLRSISISDVIYRKRDARCPKVRYILADSQKTSKKCQLKTSGMNEYDCIEGQIRMLQPQYPILPEIEMTALKEFTKMHPFDPTLQVQYLRNKFGLRNEGVTQDCSNFGKPVKPLLDIVDKITKIATPKHNKTCALVPVKMDNAPTYMEKYPCAELDRCRSEESQKTKELSDSIDSGIIINCDIPSTKCDTPIITYGDKELAVGGPSPCGNVEFPTQSIYEACSCGIPKIESNKYLLHSTKNACMEKPKCNREVENKLLCAEGERYTIQDKTSIENSSYYAENCQGVKPSSGEMTPNKTCKEYQLRNPCQASYRPNTDSSSTENNFCKGYTEQPKKYFLDDPRNTCKDKQICKRAVEPGKKCITCDRYTIKDKSSTENNTCATEDKCSFCGTPKELPQQSNPTSTPVPCGCPEGSNTPCEKTQQQILKGLSAKYAILWEKIVNYFKARPNCPAPDEWKKKAIKDKAEKYAKQAGLILVDPKDCNKNKSNDLPKVITVQCNTNTKDNDLCKTPKEHKRCFGTACQIQLINGSFNVKKPKKLYKQISFSIIGYICPLQNLQNSFVIPYGRCNNNKVANKMDTMYLPMSNSCLLQNRNSVVGVRRYYSKNTNFPDIKKYKDMEKEKKKVLGNELKPYLEDTVGCKESEIDETESRVQTEFPDSSKEFLSDPTDDMPYKPKAQVQKVSALDTLFCENTDPIGLNKIKILQDYFSNIETFPDMTYEEIEKMKTNMMVRDLDILLAKTKKPKN